MTWKPIETFKKEQSVEGFDPLVLIGCFHNGQLLWAIAARWGCAMYGDIHCASRTGWYVDYAPHTAKGSDLPKPSGEWIVAGKEFSPTHWMELAPLN